MQSLRLGPRASLQSAWERQERQAPHAGLDVEGSSCLVRGCLTLIGPSLHSLPSPGISWAEPVLGLCQGGKGSRTGGGGCRPLEPGVQGSRACRGARLAGELWQGSPIVLPGPARTPSGHPSHPTVGVGAALPTPRSHLGTKQSLAWRFCLGLSERADQ